MRVERRAGLRVLVQVAPEHRQPAVDRMDVRILEARASRSDRGARSPGSRARCAAEPSPSGPTAAIRPSRMAIASASAGRRPSSRSRRRSGRGRRGVVGDGGLRRGMARGRTDGTEGCADSRESGSGAPTRIHRRVIPRDRDGRSIARHDHRPPPPCRLRRRPRRLVHRRSSATATRGSCRPRDGRRARSKILDPLAALDVAPESVTHVFLRTTIRTTR